MILPAIDYQKIYLEKRYPEILKKISETIDANVYVGFCSVIFSGEEWFTFNVSEFESYLKRLGFGVSTIKPKFQEFYILSINWI